MKLENLKEKYVELQKEYNLPEFDVLDKEFEIKDITNENIILREIRDRILEKTENYSKILEGIIQPDQTMVNMYETKVFSDEEKNDIFEIFKKLTYIGRFSLQTELEDGDLKVSEFINFSYKEWISLKNKILNIIIRLKESWTKKEETYKKVEYCG